MYELAASIRRHACRSEDARELILEIQSERNMATCSVCEETVDTFKCTKCEQLFCFTHLQSHRDKLIEEFCQIQDGINDIRQRIQDKKANLKKHPLMKTIDAWEANSIRKIREMAAQARESLTNKCNRHTSSLEEKLDNLSVQVQNFSKKTICDKAQMKIWEKILGEIDADADPSETIEVKGHPGELIYGIRVCKLDVFDGLRCMI